MAVVDAEAEVLVEAEERLLPPQQLQTRARLAAQHLHLAETKLRMLESPELRRPYRLRLPPPFQRAEELL